MQPVHCEKPTYVELEEPLECLSSIQCLPSYAYDHDPQSKILHLTLNLQLNHFAKLELWQLTFLSSLKQWFASSVRHLAMYGLAQSHSA